MKHDSVLYIGTQAAQAAYYNRKHPFLRKGVFCCTDVHLPGLEPGTTDPKSVMISISLQVQMKTRVKVHFYTNSECSTRKISLTGANIFSILKISLTCQLLLRSTSYVINAKKQCISDTIANNDQQIKYPS